jgi:uncharacterized protein (DUF2384 family)
MSAHLQIKALQQLATWEIAPEQVIAILGLSEDTKPRHLQSYLKGDRHLPDTTDTQARLEHIAGITEALATTFPFSAQMRTLWLQRPHRRFQQRTPLAVILEEGLDGLQKVRMDVDCAYSYAIADAMYAAQQKADH